MSMNTVRVGAARFVMTTMSPFFSAMNKRFVSPGRLAMATGFVKLTPGKAFVNVKPVEGGLVGNCSVVFGTRSKGPAAEAFGASKIPTMTKISRARYVRHVVGGRFANKIAPRDTHVALVRFSRWVCCC